jgi:hypothetical protein
LRAGGTLVHIPTSGNIRFVTFGEIIVRQVVGAGEIVEEVGVLGNVFS